MTKFDKSYIWCVACCHWKLTHFTNNHGKHRGGNAPTAPAAPILATVATTPVVLEPIPALFSLVQYGFNFSLVSE